jgi:hypothetical protein
MSCVLCERLGLLSSLCILKVLTENIGGLGRRKAMEEPKQKRPGMNDIRKHSQAKSGPNTVDRGMKTLALQNT